MKRWMKSTKKSKHAIKNNSMKKTIITLAAAITVMSCAPRREPSLKSALDGKFLIGAAINESIIRHQSPGADSVIFTHFNAIEPENCMKSMEIHPEKDVYNWELADKYVDYGTSIRPVQFFKEHTYRKNMNRRIMILSALLAASCTAPRNEGLWKNADIAMDGSPAYEYRILDHWDNLDDTVERGYAGGSIWEWTSDSIPVVRIMEYGELLSSDPLDSGVIEWWRNMAKTIYGMIPDFGGYLVKASSEGQPGPQDYGRSHVEGANMLAETLRPYGGIVMWRAFVYAPTSPDRANQAVEEFVQLDGEFADNVTVQIKNGPIDFQPREPFSPLFGRLHKTSMAPELQIAQEYLGQSKNLTYLGTMWEDVMNADTFRDGDGSTVATVTSGSPLSLIAGVANTGQDDNWSGSIFAQANWYAFGRLAWDPSLSAGTIAEEWIRATFPKPWYVRRKEFNKKFVMPVKEMMMTSRETCVDFMMPLGLHHLFSVDEHYGPQPWYSPRGMRPDWLPPYYHKADSAGIGFDRTAEGSGNVLQYNEPLSSVYGALETCPENLLLWFHHVPWSYRMKSGATLWEELCRHYDKGVKQSQEYLELWRGMKRYVDKERHESVTRTLETQVRDARWWRDACVQYFRTFSGMDIPEDVEQPAIPLEELMKTTEPPVYQAVN